GSVAGDGWRWSFEPRRFVSMAEPVNRFADRPGTSGFFRLHVPAEAITPGAALRLRVDLPPSSPDYETTFYVSPRSDALREDLACLREQVAVLHKDLVTLKQSHEMLYAQVYPQLFPNRLLGRHVFACVEATRHIHPANVTVLRDNTILIT